MNTRPIFFRGLLLLAPLFASLASAQADGKGARVRNVPAIPAPQSIVKIQLTPDTNAISGHGAKLNDNTFKYLLGRAKLLSPAEAKKIRQEWQFAPYYTGNFTTKQGTYRFDLFLGGLGLITPPNQSERTFTFQQPQ